MSAERLRPELTGFGEKIPLLSGIQQKDFAN
jgi:hypothetical protein